MSRYLLLLILLPLSLCASKILSYNIYERTDRADVMITFDTPFEGKITQSSSASKIIIRLDGASIESAKIKKVNSNFLNSLAITPIRGETQIVASVAPDVRFIASKTSDGYGLRLRFVEELATPQQSSTKSSTQQSTKNPLSTLPTKKDEGVSKRYYIVVGFLVFGILALLYFKRKIQNNEGSPKGNSWLFKPNQEYPQERNRHSMQSNEVSIRFQKSLNEQTSVVMLDFTTQSYLVLIGQNNILLDKFSDNIPTTQQEFETILQSRHEQLEDFLGESSSTPHAKKSSEIEPLQAYKERAASLYNQES